jgi:hypothetical protein
MKKTLFSLASVLIAGSLLLFSCKKDDDNNDPQPCNYALLLEDEANVVIAAGTAYGNNQNPTTCQAYVDALSEYLAQAELYVDCATLAGQGAELQAAIDQNQAALAAIQC